MTPPTYTDRDGNQVSIQDGWLYLDVAGEEVGSVALTPDAEHAFRTALAAITNGASQ